MSKKISPKKAAAIPVLPGTSPKLIGQFRNRIKEFKYVPAASLQGHPKNWRSHPPEQISLLNRLMGEIGYAGVNLVIESKDGNYVLIDGHARTGLVGDNATVPVLVLNLSEHEAEKLLASYDPIALIAEADLDKLADLLSVNLFEDSSIKEMIDTMFFPGVPKESPTRPGGTEELYQEVDPPTVNTFHALTCPNCGHRFNAAKS